MGRWFLDFRSSPPGDGYPLEEHLPRRENSCVVHAPQFIGNLRQNCIPPCAILLTKKEVRISRVSRLKKEIRISKRNYVERRDHVDRSDRWILHGGWQFLFLTLFLIHESLLDLCGGFSSFKIILRLITWWDWIWNLYNDLWLRKYILLRISTVLKKYRKYDCQNYISKILIINLKICVINVLYILF